MKKKNFPIIVTTIILSLFAGSMAMAQDTLIPEVILPDGTTGPSKVTLVKQLPQGTENTFAVIIANVIRIVLAATGSLAFASPTVGGIMMVTARGNEDQIAKGKKILLLSLGALAIIAASYGIVLGITQLKFFQ